MLLPASTTFYARLVYTVIFKKKIMYFFFVVEVVMLFSYWFYIARKDELVIPLMPSELFDLGRALKQLN